MSSAFLPDSFCHNFVENSLCPLFHRRIISLQFIKTTRSVAFSMIH